MSAPAESVAGYSERLERGELSATDLSRSALERAAEHRALNAFVSLSPDVVLTQAEASDARRRAGRPLSALDGVPIAVKDNYRTALFPTTACSEALPDVSSGTDATIVRSLRAAGAVIFGKTNMHEWAYGATNTASSVGPTRHPLDPERITGGSSGGSAVAVAAGIVPAALGSDTGGSVRIPAAACGIYGFKPSYGRASCHGVLPLAWSLDAPGPLVGHLDDLGLLLPHLLGRDPADRSTATAQDFATATLDREPVIARLVGDGLECHDEVDREVTGRLLAAMGPGVPECTLTGVPAFFSAWETILHAEASRYHEARMGRDPDAFTVTTRAHLEAGLRLSANDYLRAQQLRTRFIDTLLGLGDWDALALPTLPVVAPRHGVDEVRIGQRTVTTQDCMTWFCWLGNLAGLPCISLPCGTSPDGMPIGLMLMGRPGEDERLIEIARRLDGPSEAKTGTRVE